MKKIVSMLLALALGLSLLAACGNSAGADDSSAAAETATFRMAGLKGPTTMGMVKLMADAEAASDAAGNVYNVSVFGAADEISPKLINGELDVAAIPANLAAVLYNKTGGAIQVAAVNTLGVLYVVENGDAVNSVADLAGKTVYSTGRGTTPEYVLNYILQKNGLTPGVDVTVEFKSEATEIAALLAAAGEGDDIIAVLPQPYATVVTTQNPAVTVRLDLTAEWQSVADNGLVTGVLVARKDFIEANPEAFKVFLSDYAASTEYVNTHVDEAAALVVKYGIVAAEPVAKKAIPLCNITCVTGADMKAMVSGYLEVLFAQNPAAVGAAMPDDAFYYAG